MSRDVDVLQSCLPLCVLNVDILAPVDAVEMQILAVDLVTVVSAAVVDDDCKVVGVVLGEEGIEVVLNPKLGVVVVAGHDSAHGDLFWILIEVPAGIQLPVLLLISFLHLFESTLINVVIKTHQKKALEVLLAV